MAAPTASETTASGPGGGDEPSDEAVEAGPRTGVCSPEYVVELGGSSPVFDERLSVEQVTTEPWTVFGFSTPAAEYFFDEHDRYLGSRSPEPDSSALATLMVTDEFQHESTWVWTSSNGSVELLHQLRPPETFAFEFNRRTWSSALEQTSTRRWDRELSVSPDGNRAALVVGWRDGADPEYWEISNTFVFDLATGEVLQWFPQRARLTPRGDALVVYPEQFADPLRLVDVDSGRNLGEIEGGSVLFDSRTNWAMIATSPEQSIQLVELDTEGVNQPVTLEGQRGLGSSPDGRFAAVELEVIPRESPQEDDSFTAVPEIDRRIAIIDVATGSPLTEFVTSEYFGGVDFDPTSTYAVFWSEAEGGEVSVLNLQSGRTEHRIPAQKGAYFVFDRQDPLLHLADTVSGQLGQLDLSNGRLLITERVLTPDTGFIVDAIGNEVVYGIDGGLAFCTLVDATAPLDEGADRSVDVDLQSVEIPSGVCGFGDNERIRLEGGSGDHRGMQVLFSPDVEPLEADLNGDGSADAVVVIRCRLGDVAFDGMTLWVQGRSPSDLRRFLVTQDIEDSRVGYGARVRSISRDGVLLEIEWEAFPLLGDPKWPEYDVRTTVEVLSNGSVAPLSSEARE